MSIRNDYPSLQEILARLDEAGGFGDGVEMGSLSGWLEQLSEPDVSVENRLAASLAVVSALAEAVDNSSWADATQRALSRQAAKLQESHALSPVCEPLITAFFASEAAFWVELNALFKAVVPRGAPNK